MKRFKVIGLVLAAALAVVALTVAAVGSASAATMILPEFTGTPTSFTGTSGKGVLTSGGISITCTSDTSEGGIEANKHLGTFTITFKKCTTVGGLVKCNSLAAGSETIVTSGSFHLVLMTTGGTDAHLLLFLPAHLHLECGSTLSLVLGTLLASISPSGQSTKVFTIGVNVVNKNQEFTKYENENGTVVTAGLNSAVNEKTAEAATEESASNVINTAVATEIIN